MNSSSRRPTPAAFTTHIQKLFDEVEAEFSLAAEAAHTTLEQKLTHVLDTATDTRKDVLEAASHSVHFGAGAVLQQAAQQVAAQNQRFRERMAQFHQTLGNRRPDGADSGAVHGAIVDVEARMLRHPDQRGPTT